MQSYGKAEFGLGLTDKGHHRSSEGQWKRCLQKGLEQCVEYEIPTKGRRCLGFGAMVQEGCEALPKPIHVDLNNWPQNGVTAGNTEAGMNDISGRKGGGCDGKSREDEKVVSGGQHQLG